MSGVGPIGAVARAAVSGPSPGRGSVEEAAREFETIFVRQLLEASHVGDASGAYSSLSVDAIAMAISDGGGLGLATEIARDLSVAAPSKPDVG